MAFERKYLRALGNEPINMPRTLVYNATATGSNDGSGPLAEGAYWNMAQIASASAAQLAAESLMDNFPDDVWFGIAGCVIHAYANDGKVVKVRIVPKDDGTISLMGNVAAADDEYNPSAQSYVYAGGTEAVMVLGDGV